MQTRAFEIIATGQEPCCSPATIGALLKKGLIVGGGQRMVGQDVFGAIEVPIYEVPVLVHVQCCEWCSEQG